MAHIREFPVEKMCHVMEVSSSGFYSWRKRSEFENESTDKLDERIMESFQGSGETYGSPRIAQDLGLPKSTVARRMKTLGISVESKKRFISTTNSDHDFAIAPNLLNRKFDAEKPGLKWVSDMTYIRVNNSWNYLTVIIDLADRAVISWVISNNMTARDTTIRAFEKAIQNRKPEKGLIFHSDRGSQYACHKFQQLLAVHECTSSMSRKGNCWDNAVAESFFKTIKSECFYRRQLQCKAEAFTVTFDYIDGWYNTKRIHTTLGGISPNQAFRAMTISNR